MTTIVYHCGVMAADSRGYTGSREPIGKKRKIHRIGSNGIAGVSSTIPGGSERVRDWLNRGRPEDFALPEQFTLLWATAELQVFYASDNRFLSGPIEAPWYAIGSGAEFAMGALQMGASATEAVEIACKLDPWSEGPIFVVSDPTNPLEWEQPI